MGCAGSRTPETVRSTQAPSSAQTPAPPAAATPPAKPEPAPAVPPASAPKEVSGEGADKANVVVVDAGEEEGGPQTLVEAARAERERRATSAPPSVVINDKNLQAYAKKGQITVVDPSKAKGKEASPAAPAAPAAAPGEPVRDEQYWRNRGLEIRQRWRQADDDTKELEQKAASLRQKFYAEDDPYVRNNRIKPEWDRTLDQLRQARVEIETSKQELTEFMEEGRVAGVYPGWLNEGFDLEPEEEEPREETPPAESIEPPVMEPPPALSRNVGA